MMVGYRINREVNVFLGCKILFNTKHIHYNERKHPTTTDLNIQSPTFFTIYSISIVYIPATKFSSKDQVTQYCMSCLRYSNIRKIDYAIVNISKSINTTYKDNI